MYGGNSTCLAHYIDPRIDNCFNILNEPLYLNLVNSQNFDQLTQFIMNKNLLALITVSAICISAYGQRSARDARVLVNQSKKVEQARIGNEAILSAPGGREDFGAEQIGTTEYDLQTNASVCNRIVNHDGGISAVFTMSQAASPWADRGTGYNFMDEATHAWAAEPTTRLESNRTGWPSIAVTANGSEATIAHGTNDNLLYIMTRPTIGTGAWNEDNTSLPVSIPEGNYWPRMVAGGADGNSLHVISIVYPIDANTNPVFWEGMSGAVVYSRSLDEGATWDTVHHLISEIDSSSYYGFTADDYAIDANGDHIAILLGGLTNDVVMVESMDNGNTWTKRIPFEFALDHYAAPTMISDTNGDLSADTLDCSDGSMSVLIDDNGLVHCFWGMTRMLDDVAADASSYFPGVDGLAYWNTDMVDDDAVLIAETPDLNGDLEITIADGALTGWGFGLYGSGLTTHPSAGIDENGVLYLAFSALKEDTDDGSGRTFRHTWIMSSADDGASWSEPTDVNDDEFFECAFASIARKVDSHIHVLYQRDDAPGHNLSGDPPGSDDPGNETQDAIVYAAVPISAVGINDPDESSAVGSFSVYPNPFTGETTFWLELRDGKKVNADIVDIAGRTVKTIVSGEMATGRHTFDIDLDGVGTGIYFVKINVGREQFTERLVKM